MRMTGHELQASTQGEWYGTPPSEVFGLSTDTRSLRKGEAFLALRGPTFDGHRFVPEAMERGASALIVDRKGDGAGDALWQSVRLPRLVVNNTLDALGDVASAWRKQLSGTVVAITGSYGKTTVRSMLEHGLRRMGLNVAATKANDNNLIGVPQTILSIEQDADVALVECGVSETGEMRRLARMLQPDVAMITGLAPAHAEGLGDLRGVAREKGVLLQHLTENGCAVLGAGVSAVMRDQGVSPDVVCMDMDDSPDGSVVRWQIRDSHCLLRLGGETATVELNVPAPHQAADMALAATVIHYLTQKEIGEIAEALSGWQAVPGRMQCLPGVHASTIIHDAYNANPASMAAALDTLRRMPGRHFAVLGDMAELGEASVSLHAALDVSGMDGLILAGQRMKALADTCATAQWVPDADVAMLAAKKMSLGAGDVVLVKGSRCMGLEKVVDALMEQGVEMRGEKADAV
ncbi:MAG: UDP-N-acetylmuramoyl-tripeptide--D-alanyl-D-alanine ligase [Zetaproteobacteria bacterium]|nr:MAG: UDP-N-acetylmuramoyl-tripeptide--D-alanyl-D-alanine ligase [Zetaproteobacteria bacterium]